MNGTKSIEWCPVSRKANIALILCLLCGGLVNVHAQSNPNTTLPTGVSVAIRYYDQAIYFPGSDIEIKVTISNDSGNTYQFELADNRMYSLDFDVRSMTNVEVPRATKFTTQMNSNQPAFFRNVSINPGEAYSFTENLQDYRNIADPGMYVVTASFYPNLRSDLSGASKTDTSMKSNRLTLSVSPSVQGIAAVQQRIDQQTGAVLAREALPPDQVVSFTLQARQHGNWDRFFLYLDLEALLRRDPAQDRRFVRMSQADQQAMIAKFRNDLKQSTTASDISVIPTSFRIVQTSYTPDRGTVQVLEDFDNGSYTEVKRYTYTVQRKNDIWYITDYEVQNLGTK